jgi:hypothetical protein
MRNSTGTVEAAHRYSSFDAVAANAELPALFPSESQFFCLSPCGPEGHRAMLCNSVQEARRLGQPIDRSADAAATP